MKVIETLLAQYPASISALAAASTLAAVIVALCLARRQYRPRLQVFANISSYIAPDAQRAEDGTINPQDMPQVVTVTMINVGLVPVSISYWSSFVWSVPGGTKVAAQNPAQPDFRHQPIELQPGRSADIVLSEDLPGITVVIQDLASTSRYGNWSCNFPRLTVSTEGGHRFRARLGKSLRELASGSNV